MKKLLFSIGLLFSLISCQKEIEYEGEGREPIMVLNAVMEVNKPPTIGLTRSVFFLSNNPNCTLTKISNASVKLTDLTNNIEYLLNGVGFGMYEGTSPILPNTTYKIEISHPDYPTISSQMTTVSVVPMNDFTFTNIVETYGDRYLFNFLFQDPSEDNYFAINLLSKRIETEFDFDSTIVSIDTVDRSEYVFSNDIFEDTIF